MISWKTLTIGSYGARWLWILWECFMSCSNFNLLYFKSVDLNCCKAQSVKEENKVSITTFGTKNENSRKLIYIGQFWESIFLENFAHISWSRVLCNFRSFLNFNISQVFEYIIIFFQNYFLKNFITFRGFEMLHHGQPRSLF